MRTVAQTAPRWCPHRGARDSATEINRPSFLTFYQGRRGVAITVHVQGPGVQVWRSTRSEGQGSELLGPMDRTWEGADGVTHDGLLPTEGAPMRQVTTRQQAPGLPPHLEATFQGKLVQQPQPRPGPSRPPRLLGERLKEAPLWPAHRRTLESGLKTRVACDFQPSPLCSGRSRVNTNSMGNGVQGPWQDSGIPVRGLPVGVRLSPPP